jgi:energy-coupling factor transport system permease protein
MLRLDPRTSLALWLMATLAVLTTNRPWAMAAEALLIVFALVFLGLFRRWISALRMILPIAALVFIVTVVSLDLREAVFLSARILCLLTASFIVFQKVTIEEMGRGLRRLGLPHWIAFMLTSSMRYVPLLGERLSCIMDAQKSRGIDLRPRLRNLHNFLALAVPLLIQAILLSENLAMAMEARGFSRKRAGHERRMRLALFDYVALLSGCGLLTVFLMWG